ncbi:pentatricopeptide repeat-containing protein, mitochondrial [Iris pallida]|uniref:Pentatricopeptide repeat-containing protein, mitochondrial n=2 Tax=Iris pallida TaxID=29817 RepID=A0AAX6H5V0_IRIPA|nr:pentatricopeptide repeat-containing protein, mitochondrial [Iris pallida]
MLLSGIDPDRGPLYSKLVALYASCGDGESSALLFRALHKPTAFAWNWIILASAFRGDHSRALRSFAQMLRGVTGVRPNERSFAYALKACVGLLDIKRGKELHCVATASGLEPDVSVANALIDMYCKCGVGGGVGLELARRLFDKMPERSVVTWTCMISGYSCAGNLEDAWVLFESMKCAGIVPNGFTWNAMIAGYARNPEFGSVFRLLKEMKDEGLEPDLVSWNAVVAGLSRNGRSSEALGLLGEMIATGIRPNAVTITGLLPACGKIGSLQKCKEVHGLIYRAELHANVFTETALVDVYSKCGSPGHARRVFDRMEVKNATTYNAMISCHGKHGEIEESIELFDRMRREGFGVDEVTYTCLLSACRHVGLVDKGLEIFGSKMKDSEVEPGREHYTCIVDLLCHAGRLEEAYELVKKIPVRDSVVGAFVAGCRVHGRSDMAEIAAKELGGPAGAVLLSNIYAEGGRWERVEGVRKSMKDRGVCKMPGCSWVEEKN